MKKLFLCVMLVALSVSAAFGGAAEDLIHEVWSATRSAKSEEEALPKVRDLLTLDRLQSLINSGADVNAKGEDGMTLLMLATISGNTDVIKLLLNAGADVNAKERHGYTPLLLAAEAASNPEVIKVLLNAGADLKATNNNGITLLMLAAQRNSNPEVIKALLDAGADVYARKYGKTVKDYAAENKNSAILKAIENKILEDKPIPGGVMERFFNESLTFEKTTNPQEAIQKAREAVTLDKIQKLINSGENINAKGKYNYTVLMMAAARSDNPEVIKALLNAGADVKARHENGMTALMFASRNTDNPEVVRLLLNAGSDVKAKDHTDRTAKNYAEKFNSNKEIVKILTEAEMNKLSVKEFLAEVVKMLRDTKSPREVAQKLNGVITAERVKSLIASGEDIDTRGERGVTLLMVLTAANNPKIIKLLLEAGADVNAKNEYGYTPLLGAAEVATNPEVTKLLLNAGSDVKAAGKDGKTALMLAAQSNSNPNVIKALLDAGADVNVKDKNGMTAKDYAAMNKNLGIRAMFRMFK